MSKPMDAQPKYTEIVKMIDFHYRTMKSMRPLPPSGVKRCLEEFAISNSHNSNAIEGNTFTYDETRLLLKEGIVSSAHDLREHNEIVGYKKAFDFLYEALKKNAPVTEDFLCELHKLILPNDGDAGKYRTIRVYIGDPFRSVYEPCAPQYVREKMQEYFAALQADMRKNAAIKNSETPDWFGLFHDLATHHIAYERIHPFIDGNGRTGRLLLTYEMISLGLLPVDIRYEERNRYYAAFTAYDKKERYSDRPASKTEGMAKLLAESELRSMQLWNKTFADYVEM